jgi:haloalkane dehalogenase
MYPLKTTDLVAKEMKKTRLALSEWRKPAAVMFSDGDPIHGAQYQVFRDLIPTGNGPHSTRIKDAGHFLQEDKGEEIAERILEFLRQPAS